MERFVLMGLLLASMSVSALELDGAKLDDKVQVGNAPLVLNGAGVRSVMFIDAYAAGLYLSEKKNTAEAVMADAGGKRLELYVFRENDAKHFLEAIRKGIERNRDAQQVEALRSRMEAFNHLFDAIKEFKKGQRLDLDWVPGGGVHVGLDGKELGKIEGEDFYRALLAVWIGDKPAKDKLKKELLGG